jgi:hypothetical protein
VATYWWAYQSRWLPLDELRGRNATRFARVLFEASRHWTLELHFNKGQAGAAPEAVARGRRTAMNPAVFEAAALVICSASSPAFPGAAGERPDAEEGARARAEVSAAMSIIREATPGAGSYVNEADYFEPDWQTAFWGENYPRLLAIKRKMDPDGLFWCHHCVGSEDRPPR